MSDKPPLRRIVYQLDGHEFIGRGSGTMADILARSIRSKLGLGSVTVWPCDTPERFRAVWYDPRLEVTRECPVQALEWAEWLARSGRTKHPAYGRPRRSK